MRSIAELTDIDDPAWPGLQQAIERSPVGARALPPDPKRAPNVLHALQVSTHSTLGALALHTGGVLIDHGWLRVLGGGGSEMPDLAALNHLATPPSDRDAPGSLLVAFDVIGGRFAIDDGELGIDPGRVCYFAPDTLAWESLGLGHTAFVDAMLAGSTTEFYAADRWKGWEEDVAAVGAAEGLSQWPPPFSAEARSAPEISRRPVPITELWSVLDLAAAQRDAS